MKTATLGYKGFGDQIRRISDKIGAKATDVAQNITIKLFTKVIMRSPVDTGAFRANWNFSVGAPDLSVTKGATSTNKEEEVANAIKASGLGRMYLSNGLPYAGIIEFGGYPNPPKKGSKKRGESGVAIHVINGFSMQAPQGVVRVSFAEVDSIINEVLGGR